MSRIERSTEKYSRRDARLALARALYEWDDGGCGPFDRLPPVQHSAFLNQADYILDRFKLVTKAQTR